MVQTTYNVSSDLCVSSHSWLWLIATFLLHYRLNIRVGLDHLKWAGVGGGGGDSTNVSLSLTVSCVRNYQFHNQVHYRMLF